MPRNDDGTPHLTLPDNRGRWAATSAVVHRSDLCGWEIDQVGGVLVTSALRTLLDLARCWPLTDAVAAADHALRCGLVGRDELLMATGRAKGRGASRVRAMGSLADPSAESPLESSMRVVLALANLLPPATQYAVLDAHGRFVARLDFAWPELRLGLEADGFGFHADRQSMRRDRERTNALEQLDWRLLRFMWEHVHLTPEALVREVSEAITRRRAAIG